MKMQEAMDMINNKPKGYKVAFEWCGDGMLRSAYFPDGGPGDLLIATEHEAWELADRFARATVGKTCNLYVVDHTHHPVEGYKAREIANR